VREQFFVLLQKQAWQVSSLLAAVADLERRHHVHIDDLDAEFCFRTFAVVERSAWHAGMQDLMANYSQLTRKDLELSDIYVGKGRDIPQQSPFDFDAWDKAQCQTRYSESLHRFVFQTFEPSKANLKTSIHILCILSRP